MVAGEKTALEILREGRSLISTPKRWTTDAYARDADGFPCDELESIAVCWCSLGALNKASGILNANASKSGFNKACELLKKEFDSTIWAGNDYNDHAWVISKWDDAVEKAKLL